MSNPWSDDREAYRRRHLALLLSPRYLLATLAIVTVAWPSLWVLAATSRAIGQGIGQ